MAAVAFGRELTGRAFDLTGPEVVDPAAVAPILSWVSGRSISYQAIPEQAMLAGLRGSGMPEGLVQYVAALYAAVRAGHTAGITPDCSQVTGRAPRTFETFAREIGPGRG